ncbi:MAG: FG-GAP-like repeat-containing protein [Gemmatimonadaceae bacterium]
MRTSVARGAATLCVVLVVLVVLFACARQPPPWHQEAGYRWRELEVRRGKAGFTRMSRSRGGIQFQNTVSEAALLRNRILGQGAGVALGDVDGDGLVDVFLARTEGCNALYRNLGGWRFEDITERAGVGACDRYSTASAFADIEGDGDLDLILLATTGPNAIFLNDGRGAFVERRDLGLDTTGRGGTTIAMADVDGDARLDLYVANYKSWFIDDSIPPQERPFNEMVRQVTGDRYEVVPEFRDYYKLVMRPDMGGLRLTTRADPDEFYLNDGGGTRFRRIPRTSSHFRDATGTPLTEEPESFGLGARFADLNMDGAPDLYVANDFEDTDELWFNDGRGNFRLADWRSQRQQSNAAMGVDVGDVNGDGMPDLFVVDMLSKDTRRLKMQVPTHTALPKRPGDIETQLQQQRNTLFINRGDGTFSEVSAYAGVQASGWSWSTMFLDVDLDGWQDILITAGHLWDIMDADTHERLQSRMPEFHWQRFRWQFPPLRLKNVAFRNRGDLTFEDVGEEWRFAGEEAVSHTIASGDLDGDGDLDVVVNRLGSPALVLRNDADAPRVAVRLAGAAPNTRAVGAKIRLLGGAVPIQEKEVAVGGIYMSHNDYQAVFAMGSADSATIVVEWRDGRQTMIENVRQNRLYEIDQGTAIFTAEGAEGRRGENKNCCFPPRSSASSAVITLFEDATSHLGGHTHRDPPFDDWERQFLLPNSLAHFGPGVAWFDYDRDGDEDLVVGAGRAGRLGVFRNDRGRLTQRRNEGATADADFTSILGAAADGSTRLLIGVSSWEGATPPAAVSVSANTANGVAATASPLILARESSTGPMALGDYDNDGDLDLFIGGGAVPGQYPRSSSSALYNNDGGRYKLDTAHARVLDCVGLVSAASFADIDGDGDADLILAREWSSILLLLNDRGRLTPAPDSWGLSKWTSRWNGIATGDLDSDGRLDLVATSWGRNTMTPADSARPLVLLHGPIGSRGQEELLLAREDPRVRGLAPLNSYQRVRISIPGVPERLRTFADYAGATVERVLGPAMTKVERKPVITLDQMAFLNRGNRFEPMPLPTEAQFAPAFYAGIADFDGDGAEDVFLSQNFFASAVGIPRYDAGRGLLLTGNGKGALSPMAGARSGVLVYGDQRGAAYADYDADGRLDLVVSQNAASTRLLRNRGAKIGLRVRLQGPSSNPDGVGAQIRIAYTDRMGPVREVQAGSGYWSQNGAVQVFGLSGTPSAVWVRWPGGLESRVSVPAGAREVVVKR